jgi:hypothetical protein
MEERWRMQRISGCGWRSGGELVVDVKMSPGISLVAVLVM